MAESSSRNNLAGGSQKWGVRREGCVMALAITQRTTLETYRTVVRLQIEVRDRTLARTGPHSGLPHFLATGGGIYIKTL